MKKLLTLFLTLLCAFGLFVGNVSATSTSEVANVSANTTDSETSGPTDYAGQAVLNLDADSKTMEVTVKAFIDGDTTHFHAEGWNSENLYKARYAAVNTPESTGKLEPWGKAAAKFTRSKLESATSIIIETDGTDWEPDSTGDRYLSWVWYKAPNATVYRNLNLELLQEGLAIASKTIGCRYEALCTLAIDQATQAKLRVYSQEPDPDFFYGSSVELDLKELRLNIDYYKDKRVAFEGVIAYYENQGVYVEDYDEETDMYYGVYVYYGFFVKGAALTVLEVGNKVRITGVVQYYENGDSYQVSDLTYNKYKPTAEDFRLIEKGHTAANVETTAEEFTSKVPVTADFTTEDENGDAVTTTETKNIKYSELALNTSISMKGLFVKSAYTTNNGGDNDGAMTLTCTAGGKTITVRTAVLRNPSTGELATQDMLIGETIDVRGIVDYYGGDYQIKVLTNDAMQVNGEPLFPPAQPPVVDTPTDTPTSTTEGNGCGSVIAVSAVLPLMATAFVLIKKREN